MFPLQVHQLLPRLHRNCAALRTQLAKVQGETGQGRAGIGDIYACGRVENAGGGGGVHTASLGSR